MSDYMKEAERLAQAYADAVLLGDGNDEALAALLAHIQRGVPDGWKEATIAWEVCASIHREYAKKKDPFFTTRQADFVRHTEAARAAMRAHIQREAVPEGDDGKRVLREVFALCEDTEAKCYEDPSDFSRGRRFEAKGIARAIGAWYQEEFCGRTHMGEPAAPAPDQFRDAAEMTAEPAEVKLYAWRPSGNGEYSFYVASTSEEAARIAVQAEVDGMRIMGGGYETNGWGTDYYTLECVGLNEVMTNDND